jgi:hypothetical protein
MHPAAVQKSGGQKRKKPKDYGARLAPFRACAHSQGYQGEGRNKLILEIDRRQDKRQMGEKKDGAADKRDKRSVDRSFGRRWRVWIIHVSLNGADQRDHQPHD